MRLPLVYNTSGYDSPEALAPLDGVVDIYMPDMKYGDETLARKYSHVRDYVRINREAVREMHRQVGELMVNADGLAERGLLVRHLVLPNEASGVETVTRFLPEQSHTRCTRQMIRRACGCAAMFQKDHRRLAVGGSAITPTASTLVSAD